MKSEGKGKFSMKIGKYECRVSYSYQGLTEKTIETYNRLIAQEIRRAKR